MKIQFLATKKSAELSYERLRFYIETMERLLSEEFSRLYIDELMKSLPTIDENNDVEPSDELVQLRDDFPNISRASTLPYIYGHFEQYAYKALRYLPNPGIERCPSTKKIFDELSERFPGAFDDEEKNRLNDYKQIRDACTHNFGNVSNGLYDPKRVVKAANNISGITHIPMFGNWSANDMTPKMNKLKYTGKLDLSRSFLLDSLQFHFELLSKIFDHVENEIV
jgi:hypothetical protein